MIATPDPADLGIPRNSEDLRPGRGDTAGARPSDAATGTTKGAHPMAPDPRLIGDPLERLRAIETAAREVDRVMVDLPAPHDFAKHVTCEGAMNGLRAALGRTTQ